MKKTTLSSLFLIKLLVVALLATGCTTSDPYTPYTGTYQEYEGTIETPDLQNFASVEEYQELASSSSKSLYGNMMYGLDMVQEVAMPSRSVELSADTAMTMNGGGLAYSETNNQVTGVDEADIIKTDGEYIYTITGSMLYIVEAYPAEDAQVLSTVNFEEYNPTSMFIVDDKLVVFGTFNDNDFYDELGFRPRSGMTFVQFYDVSDRNNPVLDEKFEFEGRYFDARLIDDDVYLVVQASPGVRDEYPTPIIIQNDVVRSMPIDDMFFRPMPYNYLQLITTHAINVDDYDMDSVAITTESLQTVYMSENNIYLVGQEYISEWELREEIIKDVLHDDLTQADRALIASIKKIDNKILNQAEKEQKIMQVYYYYIDAMSSEEESTFEKDVDAQLAEQLEELEYLEYSLIDKISADNGKLAIASQGKVPGQLSNQFSLDEYEGNLRVATTINTVWSSVIKERSESTNNVWVLDDNLEIVGQLTGLAEGERIYSTRFVGDRLYMVTFRQIDPFFVIDLSNPQNPRSLGELKIPGFSRYLHPYDENHIIGIGREATDMGRTQGLKISLFDVSDVVNPKEVAKFVTQEKYASSIAEYEHKAFLFSKEKNLLVIPAYSYNYRDEGETYNGALVFDIDTEEIELRGLIDHSGSLDSNYYYQAGVERSLYIEDMLYTKSPRLLRINSLDTLEGVKNVDLELPTKMNVY
ncbi:beta-propeller domain-containing protein [Candidatus Woesearchaeota archaeon]|nr:beta-propeller domain-containing protein [Candidatus Woesearchaeota archaeon]